MFRRPFAKVTPTADLMSYYRSFSDIPFAAEIAALVNSKQLAKKMLGTAFDDSFCLAPMAEARYKRIDIQARSYPNVLEVGVGRSPRPLIFTGRSKVNYVATDLSAGILQTEKLIAELMRRHGLKRKNLTFAAANALRKRDLVQVVRILPKSGAIAVISEGFMVYLEKSEKLVFLRHVLDLLRARGGVLITSDVVVATRSFSKPNPLDALAGSVTRDLRESAFRDDGEVLDFFRDAGFKATPHLDDVEITSLAKLNLQNDVNSQIATSFPVWVLHPT